MFNIGERACLDLQGAEALEPARWGIQVWGDAGISRTLTYCARGTRGIGPLDQPCCDEASACDHSHRPAGASCTAVSEKRSSSVWRLRWSIRSLKSNRLMTTPYVSLPIRIVLAQRLISVNDGLYDSLGEGI